MPTAKEIRNMTLREYAEFLISIGRGPGTPAHDAALAHSAHLQQIAAELRSLRRPWWKRWL